MSCRRQDLPPFDNLHGDAPCSALLQGLASWISHPNLGPISSKLLRNPRSGLALAAMAGSTSLSTPETEANSLMQHADDYSLEVSIGFAVNDTVGTLALGHYHDEDTVAAVIVGAGTNACYIERTDAIIKCQGLLTNSGGMVVNLEWGNFWSSHLPRTPYDISLDDETQIAMIRIFRK